MAGFILFMGLIIFLARTGGEPLDEEKIEPYRIELIDASKMAQRQKAMEGLFYENPSLYLLMLSVNLFIVLIFFGGIALNILLIYKWVRKEAFILRTLEPEDIKWGMPDIIKFAVTFYAFGFLFMLAEAALAKIYPVFNDRNLKLIFNSLVVDAAGIIFVLNFVVFTYRQRIASAGLTLKNFVRNFFYGITGYIAAIPVLFITMIITAIIINIFKYRPPVQPIVDILLKEEKIPVLVYSSVFAAVAGPIMEEIFFRGFMYNAVKRSFGAFWGIVVTASLFSALHAHAVGFAPIMILGVLLAYLYEKTGSLVSSITVHITHNMASLGMVFLMKMVEF